MGGVGGGGGGGGGAGGQPPNNLRGGIPFAPPLIIHPHFPSIFCETENITNVPS